MEQLSAMDASFLYFETANAPMHIGGLTIYDQSTVEGGVLGFKRILENYETRLHLARSFRQRVVRVPMSLDHPYWIEDPNFDIEFHVRHIALPKPGNWRQLCIQVARLHARALDTSRPLWEFTVIEGLDQVEGLPPGSFGIMSKIHHAAIDGVSGAEIVAAIHDVAPDATPTPPEKPWVPERDPNVLELLSRTYVNNLRQPFKLAGVVASSVPALAKVGIGLTAGKLKTAGPVPRTRFNTAISPHRVFDGRSFPLSDIRAMKSAIDGATVNDVIVTIVGGAMRKYLESKNELPKDSLIAMAPISVRADDKKKAAGNLVSGMMLAIRTDIADPTERLSAVFQSTKSSKELTNAIGAKTLSDYSQFIPSTLSGLAARLYSNLGIANRIKPFFNTVITNVPGPQIPLYMTGARMVTHFGLAPILDGMGIIHPVFSYCGQITVSFTACREMMPDPDFYAECIQSSFEELKAATMGAGVSSAKPAAGPRKKTSVRKQASTVSKKAKPAAQLTA